MKSSTPRVALVVLPLACLLAACGDINARSNPKPAEGMKASNIPAAIAVPSGTRLAFTLRGTGLQNYECRAKAGASGVYEWAFVAPEAALFDKSDALVGRHYGGPTWEYGDDSKVTGKVVADSPAPAAGSVPWLLLAGTPAPRGGVMGGVTYIQRVNTDGGIAPSDACNASVAGSKKGVHYSADYLFYRG